MQKNRLTLFAAALVSTAIYTAPAFGADDHKGHDHGDKKGAAHPHDAKPVHGGAVTVVKDVNYELVVKGDTLHLHITDHGKPADVKGATAKVALLSATDKAEVTLAVSGDHLQGKASMAIKPGTKAVATVTLPGGSATAVRFVLK